MTRVSVTVSGSLAQPFGMGPNNKALPRALSYKARILPAEHQVEQRALNPSVVARLLQPLVVRLVLPLGARVPRRALCHRGIVRTNAIAVAAPFTRTTTREQSCSDRLADFTKAVTPAPRPNTPRTPLSPRQPAERPTRLAAPAKSDAQAKSSAPDRGVLKSGPPGTRTQNGGIFVHPPS